MVGILIPIVVMMVGISGIQFLFFPHEPCHTSRVTGFANKNGHTSRKKNITKTAGR